MSAPKVILVVDDQASLRQSAKAVLESRGYRVLTADTVETALHQFRTEKPDLVLLDLELPDGSGLDACRKIRQSKVRSTTPVVILTAHGRFEEKSDGFMAGADQYLVKPVAPSELLLWVEALLRRLELDLGDGPVLEVGDLAIEREAHRVVFRGADVPALTNKELDLLYFLVKHRPKVLTRKYILTTLWKTVAVDNLVDTHISNLRKKLPPELAARVQSVPGKGYRYFEG